MGEKRAFLVLGPESSGTRLATGVLIRGGCAGDDGHVQRWDEGLPECEQGLIVWRRSLPHDGEWPDLVAMVGELRGAGFAVRALVMARDWYAMLRSQVMREHVADADEAESNVMVAYRRIFAALDECELEYVVVSYEALVQRPVEMMGWLAEHLGLPVVPEMHVYDGNAKHYEK